MSLHEAFGSELGAPPQMAQRELAPPPLGTRPCSPSPILATVMVPGCRVTANLTSTPVGCVQTVLVGPATWQAGVPVGV